MKKIVAVALSLALAVAIGIGGTLAWLTHKTGPLVNTFTVGNVGITLTESKGTSIGTSSNRSFKMVPGQTIEKDPKVTVVADSEACWLFVKVEPSGGDVTIGGTPYKFDDFINWSVKGDWTKLDSEDNVWCRPVDADPDNDQYFSVIGYTDSNRQFVNDKVLVKNTVTKEMMDALTRSNTFPTLTFTAYAIQQFGFGAVEDAWEEVSNP